MNSSVDPRHFRHRPSKRPRAHLVSSTTCMPAFAFNPASPASISCRPKLATHKCSPFIAPLVLSTLRVPRPAPVHLSMTLDQQSVRPSSNSSHPSDQFTEIEVDPDSHSSLATPESPSARTTAFRNRKKRGPQTLETRRKISYSLLGRPKSPSMRAKVSQKLKGRVPWNKGKKLSPETKARMSEARSGTPAWNRGKRLTSQHRQAISHSSFDVVRKVSPETRVRMQMARRRPGDSLVAGNSSRRTDIGSFGLVNSGDINDFVMLRRELMSWSDSFYENGGRRPTLSEIRRIAPVPIVRKFERYVEMRDRIRGLAGDVYGSVDPNEIPVAPTRDLENAPSNNSASRIFITKHGNRRMVSKHGDPQAKNVGFSLGKQELEGATDDMWDLYDRPFNWSTNKSDEDDTDSANHSLIGAHELVSNKEQLSANDFRKIGRYRLMGTMDINRMMELRRELGPWSRAFKKRHGRIPTLSDAENNGNMSLYSKFCEYVNMRDCVNGLVKEVYGTDVDDIDAWTKLNTEGKEILDTLRSSGEEEHEEKEEK